MSFIVVIPARYASTRLPGKPLLEIANKSLVEHVVNQASASQAQQVIVATDDQRIAGVVSKTQASVCMTRPDHLSGSDRIAEVVEQLNLPDETVVVNVQGDEPMIPPQLIDDVAESLLNAPQAVMATAAHAIEHDSDVSNPNVVKVVFDQQGRALYFSRSPIPHVSDKATIHWRHIGVYAYTAAFLKRYHLLPSSNLEQAESLEQLRVLQAGETIMLKTIDYPTGIGIDTEEDLAKARQLMR